MPALTSTQTKIIEKAIDKVFDRLKTRFLGPARGAKTIAYQFKPELSLAGLFLDANHSEGNEKPDKDLLRSLLRVAEKHIEAQRESTKAQAVRSVDAFLRGNQKTDLKTVLGGELADIWKKTAESTKRIIDTEGTTARNAGSLDGIVKVNSSMGIEDPIVYFVVVHDHLLCPECKRLHLMADGFTPRVYRISEIGHGYHKKGQNDPKIGGLHPHCRCSLVTLLPGYGFSAGGSVTYIDADHNEYDKQRN